MSPAMVLLPDLFQGGKTYLIGLGLPVSEIARLLADTDFGHCSLNVSCSIHVVPIVC
jgi:hypothetical protein